MIFLNIKFQFRFKKTYTQYGEDLIIKNLWLGNHKSAIDNEFLLKNKIKLIINLSKDLPSIQAAFFRYLFGLILILPLFKFQYKKNTNKLPIFKYGLRGLIHGFAVVLWFYSVVNIPMADVTAINYLTPIFTTIGAILIFKEVITLNRVVALLLSFIGAMLILIIAHLIKVFLPSVIIEKMTNVHLGASSQQRCFMII